MRKMRSRCVRMSSSRCAVGEVSAAYDAEFRHTIPAGGLAGVLGEEQLLVHDAAAPDPLLFLDQVVFGRARVTHFASAGAGRTCVKHFASARALKFVADDRDAYVYYRVGEELDLDWDFSDPETTCDLSRRLDRVASVFHSQPCQTFSGAAFACTSKALRTGSGLAPQSFRLRLRRRRA